MLMVKFMFFLCCILSYMFPDNTARSQEGQEDEEVGAWTTVGHHGLKRWYIGDYLAAGYTWEDRLGALNQNQRVSSTQRLFEPPEVLVAGFRIPEHFRYEF